MIFEPKAIPGLDKALLKVLILIGAAIAGLLTLTVSSVVGIFRAVRRRRRGGHSVAAVVLGAIATAISGCWLFYWVVDDVYHRSNPLDGLLVINLIVCVLPASWLMTAIRANICYGRGGRRKKEAAP